MRIEGSVTGGVIAGSNNVQTVTINHAVSHIHLPISERKPSSPTLEEIRIREEDCLRGISLYLRNKTRKSLLESYLGVHVEWPVILNGVWKAESRGEEGLLVVHAYYRYKLRWGLLIRFRVKESEYPILKTLHDGHLAFVKGDIIDITDYSIDIKVTSVEVE